MATTTIVCECGTTTISTIEEIEIEAHFDANGNKTFSKVSGVAVCDGCGLSHIL